MARIFKPKDLDRAKREIKDAGRDGERAAKERIRQEKAAEKERRANGPQSISMPLPGSDEKTIERAGQEAAGEKARDIFGLNEPHPDAGQLPEKSQSLTPQERDAYRQKVRPQGTVVLPKKSKGDAPDDIRVRLRPHIKPDDPSAPLTPPAIDPRDPVIDVDATRGGAPVDMPQATGRTANPDGSVPVPPGQIVDTLRELGGLKKGKPAALEGQFAERLKTSPARRMSR